MAQTTAVKPEQLKEELTDQLTCDYRIDASDIHVEVHGSSVKLTGTTPSYIERRYALEDALCIPGVTSVDNRLKVHHPEFRRVLSDEQLQSHISNVLQWNSMLKFTNPDRIKVAVNDGIVHMEGSVDAYWEKLKAEELASEVNGVVDIENMITVVPTERYQDESIAGALISAFAQNLKFDVSTITVTVARGEVSLGGSVPDKAARKAVLEAACCMPGVVHVYDNLVIEKR